MTGTAKPRAVSATWARRSWPLHHGLLVFAGALLLLHAGLAIANSRRTAREYDRVRRAEDALVTVVHLALRVSEAESGQWASLLSGEPDDPVPLERYDESLAPALGTLRAAVQGDPELTGALVRLETAMDARVSALEELAMLHREEGVDVATRAFQASRTREAGAAVQAEEQRLAELLAARVARATVRADTSRRRSDLALLASTTAVLAALLSWWALARATDRRRERTLGQLRASEDRLRTITDHLPLVLFAVDARGTVTFAEGRGLDILGVDRTALPGRNVLEAPLLSEELPRHLRRALAGEAHEVRLVVHDRTLHAWLVPTREAPQGDPSVLGVAVDVTDQVRLEGELRRLTGELERRVDDRTAQLEAANRELESFSYSVSHDLRAPLRAIDGFAAALAEECGELLTPACAAYLTRVRTAAQRMSQLIDDLLQLSRVTRAEIVREDVDVSALARSVLADLLQAAPDRVVEVSVQEGLHARADARLLRIVFENLLGNAFKFTARQKVARIAVRSYEDDGQAVFEVEDNGAGFEMAYADRLFAPFQRLHSPQDFEGTGIGLATVQRIVLRHGGRVWAEGEPDKGARLRFVLGAGGDPPLDHTERAL